MLNVSSNNALNNQLFKPLTAYPLIIYLKFCMNLQLLSHMKQIYCKNSHLILASSPIFLKMSTSFISKRIMSIYFSKDKTWAARPDKTTPAVFINLFKQFLSLSFSDSKTSDAESPEGVDSKNVGCYCKIFHFKFCFILIGYFSLFCVSYYNFINASHTCIRWIGNALFKESCAQHNFIHI